jgi:hypothetical protein
LILLWGAAVRCDAARVYQFVDYPADQEAYSLTGTITTTDDAPLDSILDTAEILDWQWSITGPYPFSASQADFLTDHTAATGVRISQTAIELPLATVDRPQPAQLKLSRQTSLAPRGSLGHALSWGTRYHAMSGQFTFYSARSLHGDAIQGYWGTQPTSIGPSIWPIAIAIPEPATLVTAAVGALILMLSVRRRR